MPNTMQEICSGVLNNHVLVVSLIACLAAQVLKLPIELVKNRKFNLRNLVTTGGNAQRSLGFCGCFGWRSRTNPGLGKSRVCDRSRFLRLL